MCSHHSVNISYDDGSGDDAVLMEKEQVQNRCTVMACGMLSIGEDYDSPI